MIIKELVTRLGFDVDKSALGNFDDKIDDTKEGLENMGAAAEEATEQVAQSLALIQKLLIGFSVATAAAGAGILALTKMSANAGDEIAKTAPLLGLSIEEFQKYRHAASLAGVSNEGFVASTQYLLRNMGEAIDGNEELVKSFGRLGLSVGDLKTLSTAEVLRQMSVGLSGIEDQATRVSTSMDILGRSGAMMGEFLAKGTAEMEAVFGDVEAFGMFTLESARAAEALNDALDRVLFFFGGIRNEMAVGLFPVFTAMLDEFREFLSVNREMIRLNVQKFVSFLTSVFQKLWSVARTVVRGLMTMIEIMGGLENAIKLFGVGALSVFILLLGPIALLIKRFGYLVIPMLRLHGVITVLTFALSALTPLFSVFIGALAALATGKAIAWLIALAGGFKALTASIIIPTLALLAKAAAIAFLILALEDLYVWLKGGKSIIGEWFGEWAAIPDKFRKLWRDIKEVFRSGGQFIRAVLSGDLKEAARLWDQLADNTAKTLGQGGDIVSGGRGIDFMPGGKVPAGAGLFMGPGTSANAVAALGAQEPVFSGRRLAEDSVAAMARSGEQSFRGAFQGREGAAQAGGGRGTQVNHKSEVSVEVVLPPGSPVEHAREVVRITGDTLEDRARHALQQASREVR